MMTPWHSTEPLTGAPFSALRREVIFRGAKWDAQVGDVCTVARAPLVLRRSAWQELCGLAEQLDAELLEMERELLGRPELLARLGLPRALLRQLPGEYPTHALRLHRYDFHYTDEGVRISEVNADVPGGLHEGTVAPLYAEHFPGTSSPGDVARSLADALRVRCSAGACVALVHATAYSDDRQVMVVLERALRAAGLEGIPCAPDHLRFRAGCAVELGAERTQVEAVIRFFPAEWLPACPPDSDWRGLVRGPVWLCNPATSVVVQSKRLPLVWSQLRAPSEAWRSLLPETRALWSAPWLREPGWLLKPALGRVGQGIVARGVSPPATLARGSLDAVLDPFAYVAQRRFRPLAHRTAGEVGYPCIGVFTLEGRAVGAYGRVSRTPFVDHRAIDAPVLIAEDAWENRIQ